MTSWRDALRQRQLAIDAADREELEAKKKCISASQESTDSENSYSDINKSSEFLSLSTAAATSWLVETDVPASQSLTSDDLQDKYEQNTSPVQERPTIYSNGIENSPTEHRETASADVDVIEVILQSAPASADMTDEMKSDADCAADCASLHSDECIDSDQISSSVTGVDSSPTHHWLLESLSSTPEHLVSTKVSPTGDTEVHFADEVQQTFAEEAIPVDLVLGLDVQSPSHKRTRKHARKRGTHTKRKHNQTVKKVETKPADDVVNVKQEVWTEFNDYCSTPSDVHLTSLSEQLQLDMLQFQPSDEIQHFEVVTDATVMDMGSQVVRHASYLKAVNTGSENTATSQQRSDSTDAAETAVAQASEDHLLSHESAKTDSM